MSTTKTAKVEISIDGFSKYMMSWFDYNKWTVNSNALLADSLKVLEPYIISFKKFIDGEWFSTILYLLILLIILRIGYRSIVCPLYCFMWRLVFCFIDSGRRSVNHHRGRNDDYYL